MLIRSHKAHDWAATPIGAGEQGFALSRSRGLQRAGGLRRAYELKKLRPVAEWIVPACRRRDPEHVFVAELSSMAPAPQDRAEPRDGRREARLLRRVLEAR